MGLVKAVTDAAFRARFVFEQGAFHFLTPAVFGLIFHRSIVSGLDGVFFLAPPGLGWMATILLAAVWPGLFDPWRPVYPINWTLPTVQCCASMIAAFAIQGWFPLAWMPGDPPIPRLDALWTRLDWLALTWTGQALFLTVFYRLLDLRSKAKAKEAQP
jgi:hypothetical protein